eukprot:1143263-Pelagomonas_calceolata.AAC.3
MSMLPSRRLAAKVLDVVPCSPTSRTRVVTPVLAHCCEFDWQRRTSRSSSLLLMLFNMRTRAGLYNYKHHVVIGIRTASAVNMSSCGSLPCSRLSSVCKPAFHLRHTQSCKNKDAFHLHHAQFMQNKAALHLHLAQFMQ